MNRRISAIFLVFVLCVTLFAGVRNKVYAQSLVNTGVVTLADLGRSEISMNGPFDVSTISFGLPADWNFTGDAQLDLNITTTISTPLTGDYSRVFGGSLVVSFNRVNVGILTLNENGTFDYSIKIPAAVLVSSRADGLMELKFTLNSGSSCLVNQNMNVVVSSTSRISFLYEEQQPDTSLINFPRPIVQSTIYPDSALLVIPDNPTAKELQSAFTVASGLGNLSGNLLGLQLITVSQLTDSYKAANHLIFIGKAVSIPALKELSLPLGIQQNSFTLPDGNNDNGIIQMVNSPWAVKNVVLVVSGNTDLGVLKAAQAVSTGIFLTNKSPNLAVVEDIQDTAVAAPFIPDQIFADLGYSARQFSNRGVSSQSYNFYIPSGKLLSNDAYLELAFGHSALLDDNTSGVVVLLNGQPIGSVRFSEATAGQAINRVKISIPPSVAIPGDNRIEIRANLVPVNNCTDPSLRGLWVVIWPESQLHLPFSSIPASPQANLDLSIYPAPMIFDATLGTTAVIFKRNDVESWRKFTSVASYLGDRSNGTITKLNVFFDDELTGVDLSKFNLIVIGQPNQLKIMDELNDKLPVPFEKGTNITKGKFLQVTYQMPSDVPVGYIELMPSPWNNEKVLIAALGNTVTGVNWGISSLVDASLRSQLAGDFAVINETRVQTVDTRIVMLIANTPVPQIPNGVVVTPEVSNTPPAPVVSHPVWLLPAIVSVVVLIVIIITVVAFVHFRNLRRNR